MNKIKIITFVLCVLHSTRADDKNDFLVQALFKNLDGEAAKMRDVCLTELLMKVEDLQDYEKVDDIPDRDLCFYKCFSEKSLMIDKTGNVLVDVVKEVEDVKKLDEGSRSALMSCLKGLGQIETCQDMKKFDKCFGGFKD